MAVPFLLIGILIAVALSKKPEPYVIPYQSYEQNVTYQTYEQNITYNVYNNCYIVQQHGQNIHHGQTINYELRAYKYVPETLLREMLRRTNYRCEECGNACSILSPWFYEAPSQGGRVEPDNLRMLCMSCGHDYGLENW